MVSFCPRFRYVGSILNPDRLNDPTLRPPEALLAALSQRLIDDYRSSKSPVDRIMYYVVGFGLHRLGVENAPAFTPYNWKEIATSDGMDMKKNYPVVYIYLLTHVYIYNTDFGTVPLHDLPDAVRQEIVDAVDELIRFVPLAFQERGFDRTYAGMVAPFSSMNVNAMYDCVSEMLFTLTRVHGKEHPLANALAVRMYEWLSTRITDAEEDKKYHGHLLAVTVGAWAVWEGATVYIPD